MKIIFDRLEPTTRGTSNGMLIKGTKEYDGREYEKFYFDATKQGDETPLHKLAKDLKKGDIIELSYDDSKFKNLTDIQPATAGAPSGKSAGSGGSGSGSGNRGSNKGNFRDPDHTDRSSAMYLAWDIVTNMETFKKRPKGITPAIAEALLAQFEDVAKYLTVFVQTGDFPNGKENEKPAENTDTKEPVPDDAPNDDIPF